MGTKSTQSGYTLVELVLAMALFSFMLLIITTGFLGIVKLHQSGIVSRTTQEDVRFGMDDMVRTVHAGSSIGIPDATTPSSLQILCVVRSGTSVTEFYRSATDQLMKVDLGACTVTPSGGRVISSSNVVIKDFSASYVDGNPASVALSLSIGSPDSTQFSGSGSSSQCNAAASGSQFCSLTTITTAATPRGGD